MALMYLSRHGKRLELTEDDCTFEHRFILYEDVSPCGKNILKHGIKQQNRSCSK
jgi:hypothetical protein